MFKCEKDEILERMKGVLVQFSIADYVMFVSQEKDCYKCVFVADKMMVEAGMPDHVTFVWQIKNNDKFMRYAIANLLEKIGMVLCG